jgi:peptidoglycan/LPS O-acetylase OafA/YrhL
MKPSSPVSHDNGFGVMRLAFAILVLVSHAPELADGNRNREILTRIFGGLSFGEFAVDGFFVISGALITASWLNATSWRDYLWRRVVRIYPGFVVAFAVCLLIVAPLGGGTWPPLSDVGHHLVSVLRLHGPGGGGAFQGQPVPDLNGARSE